eukprot:622009-Pleurochrysis_carterae.AAC.5
MTAAAVDLGGVRTIASKHDAALSGASTSNYIPARGYIHAAPLIADFEAGTLHVELTAGGRTFTPLVDTGSSRTWFPAVGCKWLPASASSASRTPANSRAGTSARAHHSEVHGPQV